LPICNLFPVPPRGVPFNITRRVWPPNRCHPPFPSAVCYLVLPPLPISPPYSLCSLLLILGTVVALISLCSIAAFENNDLDHLGFFFDRPLNMHPFPPLLTSHFCQDPCDFIRLSPRTSKVEITVRVLHFRTLFLSAMRPFFSCASPYCRLSSFNQRFAENPIRARLDFSTSYARVDLFSRLRISLLIATPLCWT